MHQRNKSKLVSCLLLSALVAVSVGSSKIHALDASFEAQATATFSCSPKDVNKKRLERFEHNAPDGSTVLILPATNQDIGGGVAFGEPVSVGYEVAAEQPKLFWSIQDVLLGPWEAMTVLDASCDSAAVPAPQSWIRQNLLLVGFAVAILLVGGLAGYGLARRKK